jgi:hypothetical protein
MDTLEAECRDLLFGVMRDRSASLEDRIDAAAYIILMDRAPDILHQIRMFGELGLKEYFESLPLSEQDELKRSVNRLLRCNALGIDRPLDHLRVTGPEE